MTTTNRGFNHQPGRGTEGGEKQSAYTRCVRICAYVQCALPYKNSAKGEGERLNSQDRPASHAGPFPGPQIRISHNQEKNDGADEVGKRGVESS